MFLWIGTGKLGVHRHGSFSTSCWSYKVSKLDGTSYNFLWTGKKCYLVRVLFLSIAKTQKR